MSFIKELFMMTVDIKETHKDRIIIYEFDQPQLLVNDFIFKFNLNPKLVDILTSKIIYNLYDLRILQTFPKSLTWNLKLSLTLMIV